MAKETKIWFSKEHPGRASGKPEVDTYRRSSDSSRTEKIGHNELKPGYGKTLTQVEINNRVIRMTVPRIKNSWRH